MRGNRMAYRVVKRGFDIIGALFASAILLIPWLVIAVLIKIVSPGPALFMPERVGKNGKTFSLLKFRTMRVDSGEIRATTLRGDTRVFPLGAFLRKSKLDETPQLINILKGEMTIIGPRPEDKINADKLYVGKHKEILNVKPGLSSPASLYDYTHGEMYEDEALYLKEFEPKKLEIELYYVRHQSIGYDLQIVCRTIVTIVQMVCGKKRFKEPREAALVQQGALKE